MEALKEHVNIATKMYSKKISLNLIKDFETEKIEKCCDEIDKIQINNNLYEEYDTIQKEMIKDAKTLEYLIKLHIAGIDVIKIKDLIEVIQSNDEKLTDYNIENIIEVLSDNEMSTLVSYAYLKYFINKTKSNLGKIVVIKNLRYFFTQDNLKMQDLTAEELALFTLPILSNYNLIPRDNLKCVYEFLSKNKELKEFILFLYSNKLTIPLNIEHYEKIDKDTKLIYEYIYKISKILDNETLYRLLLRWLNNGCNLYDLKIIESRIGNQKHTTLEDIVNNRTAYINFIFGNRLTKLNLESLAETQEELIIYAISNNKKGFLNLIEQHQEEFLNIPSSSILYNKEYYSKYVNINSLNIKDLKELKFMKGTREYFYLLDEGTYTFNEIKTLYNSSNKNAYKLYNYLLKLKVDDRILRIKQLINGGLINFDMQEDDIKSLAEKINYKSLYSWIEQDFNHIEKLEANDAVRILINYNEISRLLKEITDRKELLYVLRNKEALTEYNSLQEIKDNIENIDKYWKKLVNIMDIKQEFIDKNYNHIREFLLNNEAEIALDYYRNCQDEKSRNAYKLIVKAELMGEFKKLKYHTDDLVKEIDFNLDKSQIEEWNDNISLESIDKTGINGNIEVGEYDDFYSTMILGVEPMRTCLSYKDGMYNRCLLACFDSNKKILYAKINGKIVARAMIRLTKGSYQYNKQNQNLHFIDVENDNYNETNTTQNEGLTIFLEKTYTSGISSSLAEKIEELFIDIAENKSQKMNAVLVLSNFYKEVASKEYVSTSYYMYISKSKAGGQYLDSLSGEATVLDEGEYKQNNFLIWQPQLVSKVNN